MSLELKIAAAIVLAGVILASPPLHGQLGALDEVLLFCLPVVIAILVLAITAQQARRREERTCHRSASQDDSTR